MLHHVASVVTDVSTLNKTGDDMKNSSGKMRKRFRTLQSLNLMEKDGKGSTMKMRSFLKHCDVPHTKIQFRVRVDHPEEIFSNGRERDSHSASSKLDEIMSETQTLPCWTRLQTCGPSILKNKLEWKQHEHVYNISQTFQDTILYVCG